MLSSLLPDGHRVFLEGGFDRTWWVPLFQTEVGLGQFAWAGILSMKSLATGQGHELGRFSRGQLSGLARFPQFVRGEGHLGLAQYLLPQRRAAVHLFLHMRVAHVV